MDLVEAMEQSDVADNLGSASPITETDTLVKYCLDNHVSRPAVDELVKRGYSSLAALRLVDTEDLVTPKIPAGQRRLIVHIAQQLTTGATVPTPDIPVNTINVPTIGSGVDSGTSATTPHSLSSLYNSALLNGLLAQQQQQTQSMASSAVDSQNNVQYTYTNTLDSANSVHPNQPSWNDPQIHLSAATGKSTVDYYDICDFVSSSLDEEVVIGGHGDQQIVVKSGPKRPKLENVTLCQWSVANLCILYKLSGEGKLQGPALLDYLSYNTKIYQLVQRFSLVSVLLYDREYRKLQASMGFRWGTDVQHLHTLVLQPRDVSKSLNQLPQGGRKGAVEPQATKGKNAKPGICRSFNSGKGCNFTNCRYKHQCIMPGCSQQHSATVHSIEKN